MNQNNVFVIRLQMGENKGLEDVALEIRRGGSLEDIHVLFLLQTESDVIKWQLRDLSINLFQLSILFERFDVVQYLAIHHPVFLDSSLTYKASYQYSDVTDELLLLNAPLHLACLVGNLDIVRYLLDNKSTGIFSNVSMVSVSYESNNGIRNWTSVTRADIKIGKPFEFSIISGNIECIDYLVTNHVIQCLALRFLYAGVREPSSLLHKACSIGSAPMIDLLLERSFKDVLRLCDKNGKTPLHIAAWNGDTRSIQLLLENGANVNCMTESRNCLHILYRSKLHPYNYKVNTQLFLDYGLDVHAMDKNGKSALHILSEEIGISRIDVMCYWKKASDAITEMTVTTQILEEYSVESYQKVLLESLELLLQQGLDPNKISFKSGGNQVALEVLLQYSSLPYSQATLWLNPEIVYDSLELLMRYGANPNFESRVTNMTLFNQFINNHLKHIKVEMREQFINLFCQYGANPEIPVSKVDYASFPAVITVLEWTDSFNAAKVILGYTTLTCLQQVISLMNSQVIPRLLVLKTRHTSRNVVDSTDLDAISEYIECLKEFVIIGQMRTLHHMCKLTIHTSLRRKGCLVKDLPLPNFMKNYLTSSQF